MLGDIETEFKFYYVRIGSKIGYNPNMERTKEKKSFAGK